MVNLNHALTEKRAEWATTYGNALADKARSIQDTIKTSVTSHIVGVFSRLGFESKQHLLQQTKLQDLMSKT